MTVHAPQFTTPAKTQPWWFAALNWVTQPLPAGSFDAARWVRAEIDRVGEAPADDVWRAFEALVASLESDAQLGSIGRIAAKQDCQRKLAVHLRQRVHVREGHVQAPGDMPPPIYILGWMRSGTTALHRLLAADPDNWWPRHYETMFAAPPAGDDDRPARTQAVLDELGRISPHYQAIHPMAPRNPEECVNLFTHAFRTPQYAVQYRVPGYLRWLAEQDPGIAYDRYVEGLGVLRHHRGGGQRMVLKDPTHMAFLPSILERFPAAKFVFIHRDPVEVFSSMSSMYAYTRAMFTRHVDPLAIGPELFDEPLLQAHADGLAWCDAAEPGVVAHVRHEDLRRDAPGEVERIYATLGLSWSPAVAAGVRDHVAAPKPRHAHEHAPEAFGLRPGAIRERLRDYLQRFGL